MSPPHEQSSPDRVNAVYTRLPHTDQWPLGTFCFQGGGRVLDRAEERTGSVTGTRLLESGLQTLCGRSYG